MMSKIKSSGIANVKITLGIIIAVVLIIVFACEQKEATNLPSDQDDYQSLQVTLLNRDQDALFRFKGNDETLKRIRDVFLNSKEFGLESDSLGNLLLVKKAMKEEPAMSKGQVFFVVEEMPEFPGGVSALRQYITNSVDYPVVAQEKGIQGKVYVTFIVSKDGTVTDARIARGVDPALDREALRVVYSLPKWKPGYQRGKAVNVSYTVPINFALE